MALLEGSDLNERIEAFIRDLKQGYVIHWPGVVVLLNRDRQPFFTRLQTMNFFFIRILFNILKIPVYMTAVS